MSFTSSIIGEELYNLYNQTSWTQTHNKTTQIKQKYEDKKIKNIYFVFEKKCSPSSWQPGVKCCFPKKTLIASPQWVPPAHIDQHAALHLHPTQQHTVDWNAMPEGASAHNNTNSRRTHVRDEPRGFSGSQPLQLKVVTSQNIQYSQSQHMKEQNVCVVPKAWLHAGKYWAGWMVNVKKKKKKVLWQSNAPHISHRKI